MHYLTSKLFFEGVWLGPNGACGITFGFLIYYESEVRPQEVATN